MTDLPMTPDEAQDARADLHHQPFGELFDLADRALATIANMRTEEDHHVVDPFTNGGAYQTRRYTRLVTEWSAECP